MKLLLLLLFYLPNKQLVIISICDINILMWNCFNIMIDPVSIIIAREFYFRSNVRTLSMQGFDYEYDCESAAGESENLGSQRYLLLQRYLLHII